MKFNSIQVLRCYAVMMVLVLHSHLAVNQPVTMAPFLSDFGWLGVRLFFVISGYIIAERIGHGTSFVRYFLKRYLRVFPVYFLISVLAVILRFGADKGHFSSARTDSGAVFAPEGFSYLVKSLFIIPQDNWPFFMVGWSLEYEIIFYVLFGAAYFSGGRMFALCAMVLAALLGQTFTVQTEPFLDSLFTYFLFGCLAREVVSRNWRRLIDMSLKLGVAAAAVSVTHLYGQVQLGKNGFALVSALSFAMFVVWCVSNEQRGRGFGRRSLATFIGDISFSLYLVHWLIIGLSRSLLENRILDRWLAEGIRAAIIPMSILAAYVLWKWVEAPLNRYTSQYVSKRRQAN